MRAVRSGGFFGIDEHVRRAEPQTGQQQRIGDAALGQLQRDDIALSDAACSERGSAALRQLLEFDERADLVAEDQRDRPGIGIGVGREGLPQIGHQRRRPPSSFTIMPLANPLLSRNSIALMTSSAAPRRPSAVFWA